MDIKVTRRITGEELALLKDINLMHGLPRPGDYIMVDNHGSVVHHVLWDYSGYSQSSFGIAARIMIVVE